MSIETLLRYLVAVTLTLACTPSQAYHEMAGGPIVVNGEELDSQTGSQLIQAYGVIPAGNNWYDPLSGLWGASGGPSSGQIYPGLTLGGALRADASGGSTEVFINGRALHPSEVVYLQQVYGSVMPGRYWMNAQLIGGFEGGPAIFNLGVAAGGNGQGGGSGYNRNTYGGSLMSDGNCSGYLHPSGASVMTGNC